MDERHGVAAQLHTALHRLRGGQPLTGGGALLHTSPNGMLWAGAAARPGLLPRLLREILETRFMVKRAMKQLPAGSPLYKTLNDRQIGLKLIANARPARAELS